MRDYYLINVGTRDLLYQFQYQENCHLMRGRQAELVIRADMDSEAEKLPVIRLTEEEVARLADPGLTLRQRISLECHMLTDHTGDILLETDSCIFHSVAICYNHKAYLFAGPSGAGKSTHYIRWKEVLGDQVQMICGDKPVLGLEEDGRIMVYPSPWNGKEGWGQDISAPLAGILYLRQADHNETRQMDISQMGPLIYRQILYGEADPHLIKKAMAISDQILRKVPVWTLANKGDLECARMAIRVLTGED